MAEFGDVDIYTSSFRPMKATISGLNERVFMKLVVESKTEKVVGAHMVGDDSAEILQVFFLKELRRKYIYIFLEMTSISCFVKFSRDWPLP